MDDALAADQQAREDISRLIGRTLFVEAGAGTGKTRSLVSRIVALVCAGVELRHIAAITFTEKAAAELRDRVRQELEHAGAPASVLSDAHRERCRGAGEQIDGAAIQTLHSFAQRILSQYPIEAGLPPRLEMRDEIEAALAFDERWNTFLDELLGDGASDLPLERAIRLGLEVTRLKDVARSFHSRWDRLRPHATFGPATPVPVDLTPVLRPLTAALQARGDCRSDGDLLAVQLDKLAPLADRLGRAETDEDRIAVLAEAVPIRAKKNLGAAGNWPGAAKHEVHALLHDAAEAREALLANLRTACITPVLRALRGFVLAYAEERRVAGTLEFDDLLILARDLLRESAGVRERLSRRYTHLLIDEFQDTDPVQIEIAALLASAGAPPETRWEEVDVGPGRLFFVGDPKQSIYRFRYADIELYTRAHRRFGEETRRLTLNFRSTPGIIGWVNRVFGDLFNGAHDGPRQVAYVDLTPRPGATDRTTTPVRALGGPHGDSAAKPLVADVRRIEAEDIAQAIRAIRRERWPVGDEHTPDAVRPARFDDITILLPARTALSALERALEDAGVPFRVESQSLLYATQEVQDLTSVLAAIADPSDEVAVVAALRSPAFACSDRALEEYVRAGGRWDYRRETSSLPTSHAVVESMQALNALCEVRPFESVSALVERVIRERHLLEVAFAHRRPRETWQRLRFVLERARAFVDGGGTTLRQFVAWLRVQAESDSRVVESVVPESDDDAVRIMTVHAAKGLEFPIVIMAGLNAKARGSNPPVIWDADGAPQVSVGRDDWRFETRGYAAARDHERAMDRLEKDRLLYVAATRARDHLVVSLHHVTGTPCPAARMERASDAPRWRPQPGPDAPLVADAQRSEREADDTPEARSEWITRRARWLAEMRRAPVVAATAIAHGAGGLDDVAPEKSESVQEDAPWRRGRAGTSIGRAVHAVLQSIDLALPEIHLPETVRAQAVAEGVAGREREIERLVRAALASPAVREAVASGKFWREVYVAAPIDGTLVEGFIDLLYEAPGGLVIVDYKTDAVRDDADRDAALARYRPQGAAYALALRQALGRDAARCVFVFLTETGSFERPVPDLRSAMDEVRAYIQRLKPQT